MVGSMSERIFEMRKSNLLLALASAAAIAGCAGDPPIATSGEYTNVGLQALPAPTPRDVLARARQYYIGPFDSVSINVFGIEGLQDRVVQADAEGAITFPLVGRVDAAGLTPAQLGARLRERLQQVYVRDPQVTVNLVEARSQTVTVEGEVGKPGIYPVLGDMTLLKSLASAEGLEPYAREDIVVLRQVDGVKYAAVYNIAGIRAGNYADPAIYGGDFVIVGESAQKRRFDRILSVAPALLSPLVFLFR